MMTDQALARLFAEHLALMPYRIAEDQIETPQWGKLRMVFLPSSREFWALPRFRAQTNASRDLLVICWQHNSCLPVPCLALNEGYCYDRYELPHGFSLKAPFTKRSSSIFLGALLAGRQEAYEELARMPRATRARYMARVQEAVVRRGRPRRRAV